MRRLNTLSKILLIAVALSVSLGLQACTPKPLISDVSMSPDTITPNADGTSDITMVSYMLNRNATVSIKLYDEQGSAYNFRPATPMGFSETPYTVYFGGVVDAYHLSDDEEHDYTIIKRMLPNGIYTWEIAAQAEKDPQTSMVASGTLTIQNADTQLPGINGFSVSPPSFSPNQDGIDDRVIINLFLEKDVDDLNVYLEDEAGVPHSIPEFEKLNEPNAYGMHTYNYDGGIDAGSEPPPDGVYTVIAETRDKMGQRVTISDSLEIFNAGMPRAYILNGEVEYSGTTMVLSETLCYTLTVENDSTTYLRTIGPWPGTTYRSDENFNTHAYAEESGAFRVAMDFDTSMRNYPFRWGIGQPGVDLVEIDGDWYLPPEARALITGCVQIVDMPVRNPLYYWTGLIHEDVEIANVNNRVDPNYVTIWDPNEPGLDSQK